MLALLVVLLTVLDRIGALQNTWRLHCDESQTVAHLNLQIKVIKDSKFTKISIKCEDEDGDFKNGNEIMVENPSPVQGILEKILPKGLQNLPEGRA